MKIILLSFLLTASLSGLSQAITSTTGEFNAGNSSNLGKNFVIRAWTGSAYTTHATILNSSGYFGIGVTNPSSPLHVAGNASLDGVIYFGKNAGGVNGTLWLNSAVNNLKLKLNAFNRMTILNSNGFVGIGTETPGELLHLLGANNTRLRLEKSAGTYEAGIEFNQGTTNLFYLFNDDTDNALKIRATGLSGEDDTSPRINLPISNRNLFLVQSGGNVGVGTNNPAAKLDINGGVSIQSSNYLTWGGAFGANVPAISAVSNAGISFFPIGSSSGENMMHLDQNGNLSVGTADSKSYRLAVAGKGVMEDLVIKLKGNWPDYVFAPDYRLMPLHELENFVQVNRHLPEVPTAEDVKENGYSVNEVNEVLLKKVEELTLYIIQQQKEIDALKGAVETNGKKRKSRTNK